MTNAIVSSMGRNDTKPAQDRLTSDGSDKAYRHFDVVQVPEDP